MPRGAPDYSNVRAGEPLHRLDDMAELAARLGSPVTHHRGGYIVFLDSFESGIASWQTGTSGSGASITVSSQNKRTGAFSVKMVAGSNASRSAQISRAFPHPTETVYGFEVSVMFLSAPQYLILTLSKRDGTQEHQFQVMYMSVEKEIVVTIPGGSSVVVIDDIELFVGSGLFHTFKLICDYENERYYSLTVDERIVDLSGYEPYTFNYSSSPHTNVVITVYSNVGENDTIYVDDVILTQGEYPFG